MSNIEEKFFETFEIKPELTFYDLIRLKEDTGQEFGGRCSANWHGETKEETIRRFSPKGWKVLECKDVYTYPEITDRTLLALVCIAMEYRDYPTTINIRNIKERTLRLLIGTKKYLKDTYSSESYHNRLVRKVQALFK